MWWPLQIGQDVDFYKNKKYVCIDLKTLENFNLWGIYWLHFCLVLFSLASKGCNLNFISFSLKNMLGVPHFLSQLFKKSDKMKILFARCSFFSPLMWASMIGWYHKESNLLYSSNFKISTFFFKNSLKCL